MVQTLCTIQDALHLQNPRYSGIRPPVSHSVSARDGCAAGLFFDMSGATVGIVVSLFRFSGNGHSKRNSLRLN